MVQITYISPDELYFAAAVAPNVSVLQAALAHGRAGISGDRGACTSCRVHIGADWFDRIDPPPTREDSLSDVAPPYGPCSRLTCRSRWPRTSMV